jgi:putative membrane-bound dehydrogenase-like protein
MMRSDFISSLLTFVLLALAMPASAEDVQELPLPPIEAARRMSVPEGFRVTLFAGEPDVQQPIGFCLDDRGRLWVAEAYSYPDHSTEGHDRIIIFEDASGDGTFDHRTVFYDKLNYVTGIEVGFGGVWVMSPPYFYFIPDADRDDVPDSEPQVLLDGFGNHANSHNLANAFAWGPDGWLYGTHGRTNWSLIGKPGTPEDQRVHYDGGVYRYHPVRHEWEPFADGTTNPWGIDWDDFGEGFVCNCVNPHLFHVIQGAHYEPWRNRESSQYAYDRIATIADHLHFVGHDNVRDGLGSPEEDAAGGGHAHCGTLIYLGDNWPAKYRNTVLMNNIHGHRINNDILRRKGSGYTASHNSDLMLSADKWYMGVTLQYGPDGGVFASDWSDTGECHSVKNTQRATGRIYKITYGSPTLPSFDLAQVSDRELVELQLHRNEWYVRHARRLLQERAVDGRDFSELHTALRQMLDHQPEVPSKLRALWTLHVTGGVDDDFLIPYLDHESEHIRGWAIRLLCEDKTPPAAALQRFPEMAAKDLSPYVRLQLACALQRMPADERWHVAEGLLAHADDDQDANLPCMVWYGVEPLIGDDMQRFVKLIGSSKLSLVRRNIARRVTSLSNPKDGLNALVEVLVAVDAVESQRDVVTGMLQGLEGRRTVEMPTQWSMVYTKMQQNSNPADREHALELALIFDDPAALESLRNRAADPTAPEVIRNRAIQALVAKKAAALTPLLFALIGESATQSSALRGLAEYDDPATAVNIIDKYPSFGPAVRQDALQTLASRPEWATKMLDAVESNRIPRSDLTAYTARQLQSLNDDLLTSRVEALWGKLRTTAADKAELIAKFKKQLTPESLARAKRSSGRVLFQKTCANCHRLFDAGENVGPEITGAQRQNIDYLLENLVDPSAAVSKDFQMQIVTTASGRIITGLVVAENENAVTIQTLNERVVVPTNEIEDRDTSPVSMMPDGMLQTFSITQIRDLFAYLGGPNQVPLDSDQAGDE